MHEFATTRLVVRDWTGDLADPAGRRSLEDALTGILSAGVLRHLPEPLRLSATGGDISRWVTSRAAESDVFLVSKSDTGDLIGLLILGSDVDTSARPQRRIGYLLAEAAWGQGYATELVCGLIGAFVGRGPVLLMGGVGQDNVGSARVLEKSGFRRSPELATRDTDMFVREVD